MVPLLVQSWSHPWFTIEVSVVHENDTSEVTEGAGKGLEIEVRDDKGNFKLKIGN